MSKFSKCMYCILLIISISTAYLANISNNPKVSYNNTVEYLPNVTGKAVYQLTGSNTMKCNLTAVSMIINNMIGDYYEVQRDNSNDNLLDLVVSNGDKTFRILYNRDTRDYICFSNHFLENNLPQTYIIDK